MEHLKQPEWLNPKDRQKLSRLLAGQAGYLRVQYAAAPRSFRETYIPLLATGRLLLEEERQPLEEEHLRKMLAVQVDVLSAIPAWIGGTSELHQLIETKAGPEVQQWRQFTPEDILPRPWKNAKFDAERLTSLVAAAEEE